VGWILFSTCVNMFNQIAYREAMNVWYKESYSVKQVNTNSLFQVEWLKNIPEVPVAVFALFFTTASAIVVALWKRIGEKDKETREDSKEAITVLKGLQLTLDNIARRMP
jgi:hypothetical protein